MGVMMQAFYWDCPRLDGKEYKWWPYIESRIPQLAQTGFTALWLPPIHKAANISGPSMGYDPYDYYDLGEFDQKGAVKTWFGSKKELLKLIGTAHKHEMQVIADMVINHNSGADETEVNPINGQERWTRFKPGSGKFPRNWECFHPNNYTRWDRGTFGEMPDLSHRNPYVFAEVMKLARWMVEELGFDGFRYDFVKGYEHWVVTAIQEYRYQRDGKVFVPYGVAEFWDNAHTINHWVELTNFSNENPVDAFDFPLRELLKSLCDNPDFSLLNLPTWDMVLKRQPQNTVTFVENHDLRDEGRPIVNDKLLAYSFILTHEGYPCVFWQDYFNYDLALSDTANGIAALIHVHEKYAGGGTQLRCLDEDLYIMQRTGYGDQPGLIYVLNLNPVDWSGEWVETHIPNAEFSPAAWWSSTDLSRPDDQHSNSEGRAQFFAPPRGYAVYFQKVPGRQHGNQTG